MTKTGKREALTSIRTRERIVDAEERIARLEKMLRLDAARGKRGTLHVEERLDVFKGELVGLTAQERVLQDRSTTARRAHVAPAQDSGGHRTAAR